MKRFYTSFLMLLAAIICFPLSSSAEEFTLTPVQTTVIQANGTSETNADVVLYDASATSWLISQSKISGGAFSNMLSAYEGSPVLITKIDASSALNGKMLKSATLKFNSVCTVSGKNSNVQIASIGTGWDATTATWNNTNTADILNAVGLNGDGVNVKTSTVTLTQDVTEILNADEDKVIGFAVFTYTGRQQKISDISLTIEAIDASASSNYTVKFVDESGNELKTADTRSESTGAAASITNDDKASIYTEDGTKKYIYVSDDADGQTINGDGSTVITVKFREAATWNYTINAVDGDGNLLQVLKSGQNFEAETFDVAYAAYINVDGTIWKSSKLSSDKKGFYFSMTLSEDNLAKNVTFTASDITNVVYFSEAENIDGLTLTNNSNTFVRSSNGASAYAAGGDVVFATLPNGKYTISTIICDASKNAGSVWKFNANNETVFEFTATTVNWSEGTSEEFTLNQANNEIALGQGGSSTVGVDLIYIQKTGDAEVAAPAAATGVMNFITMNLPTSNSGNAGDITEDKTFTVDDFTVTISPKVSGNTNNRFWTYNGGSQLRMYNGTITIEAAAGKTLNKIVFDKGTEFNLTPDCGELSSNTWTGEATKVVFTAGKSYINSITVGNYVEPMDEVANIAEFKALATGTKAKLTLKDAQVTYVNGDNAYVQDETGAVVFYKSGLNLTAGTALNGYVYGVYTLYNGLPEFTTSTYTNADGFTVTETELTPAVATVADIETNEGGVYTSRLVKLENVNVSADLQTISQDGAEISFNDKFGVLPEGYEYPTFAKSVTGLIVSTSGYNFLYFVSAEPIVAGEAAQPVAESIAAVKTSDLVSKEVKITLTNAKVTVMSEMTMDAIIEDETGAIIVDAKIRNLLGAGGNVVNGTLIATVQKDYRANYSLAASDNTANSELTTEPAEVTGTLMTIADIKSANQTDIMYKYVKLENVEVSYDDWGAMTLKQGDATIDVDDAYWTLPEGIEYEKFNSIQGTIGYGYMGYVLNPYGAFDGVEKEIVIVEAANIAEMKAMDDETIVKLALNNAKVSVVEPGMKGGMTVYIEDETAGIQLSSDAQTLQANFTEAGQTINGYIYCQFSNYGGVSSINETSLTAKSEYTVEAGTIEPKVITVAEAKASDFNEKLVKTENVALTTKTISEGEGEDAYEYDIVIMKSGDDEVMVSDMFSKIGYDEEFNPILFDNCNVTGVIMAYPEYNDDWTEIIGYTNYFMPTAIEEVAGQLYKTFEATTVMNMTEENVAAAVAEGWAEGGETRTDNKKGYIDPETDEEIKGAARPGIGLKKGNAAKSFKVYVTGLDALVAYGVSTNSSERNIVVTATAEDGTVVENQGASTGTTAVVRVDLDNAKKYVVEFAGTDVDGNGADVALHDIKFIAPEKAIEPAAPRHWDFTAMSDEDEALFIAAGTELWSVSKGRYSNVGVPLNNEPIIVEGVEIEETKGLLFTAEANKLLLGNRTGGNSYMQVQKGSSFKVTDLAKGDTISVEVCTSSKTAVTIAVDETLVKVIEGCQPETAKHTCTIVMLEDGEYTLNGDGADLRFYTLDVKPYDPNTTNGINDVNAVVKVINNDVYTINGVKVRNAGESLDGLAKGLYIIGGKKVVIK